MGRINYRGITLLSVSYKNLSNILLSKITPRANEIIGEFQCGFWMNRSTVDHIFRIRQILDKKWDTIRTFRYQESNLNLNRDSNLGSPDY